MIQTEYPKPVHTDILLLASAVLVFNAQCNRTIEVLVMSVYRTLHSQEESFYSLQSELL